MTNKLTFIIEDNGKKSKVSREIEANPITLNDILDFLEDALKGVGYGLAGNLTIENEGENDKQ